MFPIDESHEYTQRILRRQRVVSRMIIPAMVGQTAKFDVEEMVGSDLLMRVTAEVLQEKILGETQTAELSVPASWWQHFKQTYRESWVLRRFVRRYPVESKTWKNTVTFERYYSYPDASVPLPENRFGGPVIYETTSKSGWHG